MWHLFWRQCGLVVCSQHTVIKFCQVSEGNVQWLVQQSIIKNLHHWQSTIKKFTSPAVMLAEAMCSGWSSGVS